MIEPSAAVAFAGRRASARTARHIARRHHLLRRQRQCSSGALDGLVAWKLGVRFSANAGHALLQVFARERARLRGVRSRRAPSSDSHCSSRDEVQRALVALHGERRRRRDLAASASAACSASSSTYWTSPSRTASSRVDGAAREQEVARRALADELRRAARCCARSGGCRACRPGSRGARPSAATRTSHATASCMPAPIAGPLIAAITGAGIGDDRVEHHLERGPERVGRLVGAASSAANRVTRSAPEQNAEPAPVMHERAQRRCGPRAAPRSCVAQLAVQRVAALLAVDRREPDVAAPFDVEHVRTRRSAR